MKLHNEELHYLYSVPNIIRLMKSRKVLLDGHIACMAMKGNVYKVLVGNLEEMKSLERTVLRWILKNYLECCHLLEYITM
jgi:hypothetical protein